MISFSDNPIGICGGDCPIAKYSLSDCKHRLDFFCLKKVNQTEPSNSNFSWYSNRRLPT